MKYLLLLLVLASCSSKVESVKVVAQPKFRVGQCLENITFQKQIVGRIYKEFNQFNYVLYNYKTSTYTQTETEENLELNDYQIVPCKEN